MRIVCIISVFACLALTHASTCLADDADVFTDMGDGTWRQNSTGLIWLANPTNIQRVANMDEALRFVATLKSGEQGLSDGSKSDDWRLPTSKELSKWAKEDSESVQLKFARSGKDIAYMCRQENGTFRVMWADGNAFQLNVNDDSSFAGQFKDSAGYIWPVKR